jgi:hypothetical protein
LHRTGSAFVLYKALDVCLQVCNGIKDCPDGEDENSIFWFDEQHKDFKEDKPNYSNQTRNWSVGKSTCFKKSSQIRTSTLVVFILFAALLLAIILVSRQHSTPFSPIFHLIKGLFHSRQMISSAIYSTVSRSQRRLTASASKSTIKMIKAWSTTLMSKLTDIYIATRLKIFPSMILSSP